MGAGTGAGTTGSTGSWTRPSLPTDRPVERPTGLPTTQPTRDAQDAARPTGRDAPAKDLPTKDAPAKDAPAKDTATPATTSTTPAPPREGDAPSNTTTPARRDGEARDARDPRDDTRTMPKPGDAEARPPRAERPERSERAERVERLLSALPWALERDPAGAAVRRAEVTLWLPERAVWPPALHTSGFTVLREREVLGRRLVVLRPPAGMALADAVAQVSQWFPRAEVDFNHLMLDSGRAEAAPNNASAPRPAPPPPAAPSRPGPPPALLHVGLIDEALEPAPELMDAHVQAWRCPEPAAELPRGHGTAVARVLVRQLRQAGRPAVLHAADLGCGPGAVDAMATALQQMAQARVPVVNLSAVGPHNRVMAAVVAAFLARGHLLVAAVGNDGPAAPPLYPAAYPGVVGVTGVDAQGRVLLEAGRGEHVAFSALGVVELDGPDGSRRVWRGTSFAAPVVAAALAQRLPAPDARRAADAVADLARHARDLGEPGWDRVYGHGLVEPDTVRLAGPAERR
ncbi:S8 family serine peptidase [Roseateles sp. BYS87W]|uniref:S8 family serine peptidase n=1 Tax=Pelomonas baiyunensis TaxID=3299026 RepID=A0ABW7H2B4_9BURK